MNEQSPTKTHSNAENPDLDWSQVRETVMMLNLAVAQLGWTLKDGDESVNTLTNSFTSMVGNAEVISEAAESLEEGPAKQAIIENSHAVAQRMQAAIIAFQFYDKLSQRLNHVASSLTDLSRLVSEPQRLYNPFEWSGLQQKIRANYTNEADKVLFDAVLQGADIEEAHQLYQQALDSQKRADDEVELF